MDAAIKRVGDLGEVDPSVVRGPVSKAGGPKGFAGSIPALSATWSNG